MMGKILTSCCFFQYKNLGGPKIDQRSWNSILLNIWEYTLQLKILRNSLCSLFYFPIYLGQIQVSTLALFVFSFSIHPLAGRNINSISKVTQQMLERFRLWTGIFDDLTLNIVTPIIVAYQIPFSPSSLSLEESRFISEWQYAQLKKKKKERNLYSLNVFAVRDGYTSVLASDVK